MSNFGASSAMAEWISSLHFFAQLFLGNLPVNKRFFAGDDFPVAFLQNVTMPFRGNDLGIFCGKVTPQCLHQPQFICDAHLLEIDCSCHIGCVAEARVEINQLLPNERPG